MTQATTSPEGTGDTLDAPGLLGWARRCVDRLRQYREEINSLNVFPVPDADTGTNLLHTMRAAVDQAEGEAAWTAEAGGTAGAREIAVALGHGAVHGARGNSGVILSQVLRAVGESATFTVLDAVTLRRALRTAGSLVDHSISDPVEGTIVTVLRAAATAAARSTAPTLSEVARTAADAAAEALEKTSSQLPVLRRAGVVDAGGRGLLVLLDTLVEVLTGEVPFRRVYAPADIDAAVAAAAAAGEDRTPGRRTRFEVMYSLTHSDQTRADELRSALRGMGDSVVVVGDGGSGDTARWAVHVHCNDIGPSIEVALGLGRISEIRVTDLFETPDDGTDHGDGHGAACSTDRHSDVPASPVDDEPGRAVVAFVEPGPLADLFVEAGAHAVDPDDGPDGAITAVLRVPGTELVVLPNGELDRAQVVQLDAALRDSGRQVLIVPTSSAVQGLSALAVHDPSARLSMDVFGMADAAAATRHAHVVRARQEALTLVGRCREGDLLGMVGRDVAVIETDPVDCVCGLTGHMLATGGELVTLLLGEEFDEAMTAVTVERLQRAHPDVEIEHFPAGGTEIMARIGVE